MKQPLIAILVLTLLTAVTGIAYPLAMTAVAGALFPRQAAGSLVERNGAIAGSRLIAQKFSSPLYFWPRPSAGDYTAVPSGASNFGPLSAALSKQIAERTAALKAAHNGIQPPILLATASASGLDPHIDAESARYQISRVAAARKLTPEQAKTLDLWIQQMTEPPSLGFLGEERLNVLELNLRLDQEFPAPSR